MPPKIRKVIKPGSKIGRAKDEPWRKIISQSRWCESSNERMFRMLDRIISLEDELKEPMFPMTKDKAEFAIHKLLCEGGENGQVACEAALHDFKRAISHWHFDNRVKIPNFDDWDLDIYFKVLPSLRIRKPKNESSNPHATHGHLQLPFNIFKGTVDFWLN